MIDNWIQQGHANAHIHLSICGVFFVILASLCTRVSPRLNGLRSHCECVYLWLHFGFTFGFVLNLLCLLCRLLCWLCSIVSSLHFCLLCSLLSAELCPILLPLE